MLARIIAELGTETVAELSRGRVKAWRDARLAAGASNKTVNNALAVLLAALSEAVESELIDTHPLAGLRALPVGPRHQRRRPRALEEFEILKLLDAIATLDAGSPRVERPSGPEWITVVEAAELVGVSTRTMSRRTHSEGWELRSEVRNGKPACTVRAADALAAFRARPRVPQEILVRVLLETGARWGELTKATWADVDTAGATLNLRAENTKTDTERSIPLRRETCGRLVDYRLKCAAVTGAMPVSSSPIFLNPSGRPWTDPSTFRQDVLGVAYERAGLLERDERGRLRSRDGHSLNVHTLRHTCCTRLLASGAPVPVVQALMGHASPQMTLRVYSHLKAESARAYVDAVRTPVAALVARGAADASG